MNFQNDTLKSGAMAIRALNHKLRQQILTLINSQTEMKVTNIYETLKIEQSVASQHLAILRRANIVIAKRDGKKILYSVNQDRIDFITAKAKELS